MASWRDVVGCLRLTLSSVAGVSQEALTALLSLLDLDEIEKNIYRGESPPDAGVRVFGGQVAGQALVAAGRTVDAQRSVHSLHAYFLRPGDPSIPIVYEVDRIRDGRSFTTRRVVAIQKGEAIFHLSASFHVDEKGLSYSQPMPESVDPNTLPTFHERLAPYRERLGDWYERPRAVDVRYVTEGPEVNPRTPAPGQQVWFRADGRLPDDPLIQAVIVAYASDMTLLDTSLIPFGYGWGNGFQMASLDHTMWFHRHFRADEWLLYDQVSPASGGARGFAWGSIYTQAGDLVVSVAQEGLIRPTS